MGGIKNKDGARAGMRGASIQRWEYPTGDRHVIRLEAKFQRGYVRIEKRHSMQENVKEKDRSES